MTSFRPLELDGVVEIVPGKFGDERGFFSEVHNQALWAENGVDRVFVQDNHSMSKSKGVLRGMHYQRPPYAQAKLVRVIKGAILDVVVDIRHKSPTYGKWLAIELSAENWKQLFVPEGFAHGFVTLADDNEVIYKVSNIYAPSHEVSIRYDDEDLGIEWPDLGVDFQLSGKDRDAGLLKDQAPDF